MPNRIVREGILTSARVNRLGPEEEVFYRRLLSAVDDYGRFDGRPGILRAAMFPLRLDAVGEDQIRAWLKTCVEAGLVRIYGRNGQPDCRWIDPDELAEVVADEREKAFVEVADFRQKIRAKTSRFPDPPHDGVGVCPTSAVQMQDTCPASARHVRTEAGSESKTKPGGGGVEVGGGVRGHPREPPVDTRSKTSRRPHFEGVAEPRPDTLDAAYDKVPLPKIRSDEDITAVTDPIELAMAVTGDREPQSWLGWVGLAHATRRSLGRQEADRRWWDLCRRFWHEIKAGEDVRNPGAALTARLKEALA